jgi:predicted membrane channel-forming protein YqfA (hemolysin III family)
MVGNADSVVAGTTAALLILLAECAHDEGAVVVKGLLCLVGVAFAMSAKPFESSTSFAILVGFGVSGLFFICQYWLCHDKVVRQWNLFQTKYCPAKCPAFMKGVKVHPAGEDAEEHLL